MSKDKTKDKLLAFKIKEELTADKSKRASRLLFYVGTAYMIFGLLQSSTFISTLFIICVSLVIIMLGLLSRRYTLVPLIIAFVILLLASCIDFMNFGQIGFIGLTIRIVLIGFLVSGIYHFMTADKLLSEYDQFGQQYNNQ